ncbi:MAG: hypothetical protein ACI4AM_10115 [Muribaculaceae bacterium]
MRNLLLITALILAGVFNTITAGVDLRAQRKAPTQAASAEAPAYPFPGVEDLIFDQPEGTQLLFNRDAIKWMHLISALEGNYQTGVPSTLIENGNEVYFSNFFTDFEDMGWLKGTKDADASTITMDFPQVMYDELFRSEHYLYYAAVLELNEDQTDFVVSDTQQIVLNIDENGNITQDNPDLMIGVCYLYDPEIKDQPAGNGSEGCFLQWFGIGLTNLEWTKANYEIATLPSDAQLQQYAMIYNGNARFVNVAIVGNSIYLTGLADDPEACAVGSIDQDNVITFQSPQFMGMSESGEYFTYFVAASTQYQLDPETLELIEFVGATNQLVLNLNPKDSSIIALDKTGFAISYGEENVGGGDLYLEPTLVPQEDYAFSLPADPTFVNYQPYSDTLGYGVLNFDMPFWTAGNQIIDRSNLSYVIYFDDQPATFTTDLYWDIPEDLSEIPYSFTDWYDFFCVGINHAIYLYEGGYERIGVQVVARNDDQELRSQVFYYGSDSAIDITNGATVIGQSYISLTGVPVVYPKAGVYIIRTDYSNGISSFQKVIIR